MASSIQSNPVYYSLAALSSGQNSSSRTVILHKRPDHGGFGVYIGEDIPSGLYIVTVERNSPASDANIQPGDRVLAVNGQLVSSMSTNPKDMLIKAATNAQSLALTIQSTNMFQTLNLPLTNNYTNNNDYNKKRYSSKEPLDISTDLENYIRSLFANENIQILPASNNNEFILKPDPYVPSTMDFNSLPNHYYHSSGHKKERRRRHHQKRTTLLETKETQTSINDDDENENMPGEQLQLLSTRQYPTYPSMGTSQRILRTQQQISNDDPTHESQDAQHLLTNKISDFTAIPPSPTPNDTSPYSTATASSPTPNNVTHNSTENTHHSTQRMVDIVRAAVTAEKMREQPTNRESTPVTKQTSAPSSSRHPSKNPSRESGPAIKRIITTSLPRDPPENSSHQTAPAAKRVTTPTRNQHSPPPYTETANIYTSPAPVNNRDNTNAGSYNVRNAEQNQQGTSPVRSDGLREVHLHRLPNFQGFGFHLQYNKSYYLVQRVEPNSPAEQSGLSANDVICSINKQTTDNMPHALFVQIVNASSDVSFLIQPVEEYLRIHPQQIRNSKAASTVAASIANDNDKPKTGLSKALGKLTSR